MRRFLNTRRLGRGRSCSGSRANRVEPLEKRVLLSTVAVTSLGDVTADDGVTTLREALVAVKALPGADQITFDAALIAAAGPDARIELASGELVVDSDVTIQGPGAGDLTIDANQLSRVFRVAEGVGATISGLSIREGKAVYDGNIPNSGQGGGILNLGTLSLADVVVSDNSTTGGFGVACGGGIYSAGGLTITNSTFSGNDSEYQGGGIYASADLTITDSMLIGNSGNSGAGIYSGIINRVSTATVTVTDCTFSNNSARNSGGGICNGANLTVTSSTFIGNSAGYYQGGGIDNTANLTVTNSTFSGNSAVRAGGGIYSESYGAFAKATTTVTHSTLSGNSAPYGGGICNFAFNPGGSSSLTVTDSALSGNSANYGGGIYSYPESVATASLTVTNSTLSPNSANQQGGGIFALGTTALLHNSIVAGNTASSGGPDLRGVFDAASSHNLIGVLDASSSGIVAGVNGNLGGTAAPPLDPLFVRNPSPGPDAVWDTPSTPSTDDDYGDLRLQAGSPAVDAGGNDLVPAGLTTDLDGKPRISGAAVDIGAFESDFVAPAISSLEFDWNAASQGLVCTFTEDVGASLTAADLRLTNLSSSTDVLVGQIHVAYDALTKTARFTFPGYPNGALPDGNYRATLVAAGITDPAGNPMPADHVYDFFVFAGDANRDRTVDFRDLAILAQNYTTSGKTFAQGNFNYDPAGNVDFSDLVMLAQRYGTSLSEPAPAATAPLTAAAGKRSAKSLFSVGPEIQPVAAKAGSPHSTVRAAELRRTARGGRHV